jgi:predicted ATP-dependent serine protease
MGKSTLLIQLAALIGAAPPWTAPEGSPLSRASQRVLYVSGEESGDQLADRADRLQARPHCPITVAITWSTCT